MANPTDKQSIFLAEEALSAVSSILREHRLPDDDLLHYKAAELALLKLGVSAKCEFGSIKTDSWPSQSIQFAYLNVNGRNHFISTEFGMDVEELCQIQLERLHRRYPKEKHHVNYFIGDAEWFERVAERGPDFEAQCALLSRHVLAKIEGVECHEDFTPDPEGSIRSGPFSRSKYQERLNTHLSNQNFVGMTKLLDEWHASSDLDKPANFPQRLVFACISRAHKISHDLGSATSLLVKAKSMGADLSMEENPGMGVIWQMISSSGSYALISWMLKQGVPVDSTFYVDKNAFGPLSSAMGRELPDRDNFVRLLLAHGADIHRAYNAGDTAIFAAVEKGAGNWIEEFLSMGADPCIINAFKQNLLHVLCESKAFRDKPRARRKWAQRFLDLGVSPKDVSLTGSHCYDHLPYEESDLKGWLRSGWEAEQLQQATPQTPTQNSSLRL